MIELIETWITNDIKHYIINVTLRATNKPEHMLVKDKETIKKEIVETPFGQKCAECNVGYSVFVSYDDIQSVTEVKRHITDEMEILYNKLNKPVTE